MNPRYYAHTADRPDGTRDPDVSKWQLLSAHLRNVAELAATFAAPFNASAEARLAGLLHKFVLNLPRSNQ